MKYIREKLVKSSFSTLFISFFFLFMIGTGCTDNAITSTKSQQKTETLEKSAINQSSKSSQPSLSSTATDREIFEGIVFFKGNVANDISYIDNHLKLDNFVADPSVLSNAKSKLDDILDNIEANNPQYFSNFVSTIRNGSQLEIEQELEEASEIARQNAFSDSEVQSGTDTYLNDPDEPTTVHEEDPESFDSQLAVYNDSYSTNSIEDPCTVTDPDCFDGPSPTEEPDLAEIVEASSTSSSMNDSIGIQNYIFLFNHVAIFLEVFLIGYFFVVAFLFIGEANLTSSYDQLDPIVKDQLIQSVYNSNI